MKSSTAKWNTLVIPVIRTDLIGRCLETLYKHTEEDTFYVYVIDQSVEGLDAELLRKTYKNLMIIRTPITMTHHAGNLGFSKATNLGIKLVDTPYFTMCNDDVEFVHIGWWPQVLETFKMVAGQTPHRPAMMVNPASIKLPDWSIGRPSGDHHDVIPYKENYTDEDWNELINGQHYVNEHLTLMPNSVIDGVTMYCSVFDTQKFLKVGMLDEKYYPGGAEDYDYCCRACMHGYRCVGTTKSWVYHHWSKSIGPEKREEIAKTQDEPLRFGDQYKIWGDRFDVWGVKCTSCEDRLQVIPDTTVAACPNHPEEQFLMPDQTIVEL
jgi:GT2 family glycosyltransferase